MESISIVESTVISSKTNESLTALTSTDSLTSGGFFSKRRNTAKEQTIKRVIDEKITEVLENIEENKDSESVDKEGTDVVKDIYEK